MTGYSTVNTITFLPCLGVATSSWFLRLFCLVSESHRLNSLHASMASFQETLRGTFCHISSGEISRKLSVPEVIMLGSFHPWTNCFENFIRRCPQILGWSESTWSTGRKTNRMGKEARTHVQPHEGTQERSPLSESDSHFLLIPKLFPVKFL